MLPKLETAESIVESVDPVRRLRGDGFTQDEIVKLCMLGRMLRVCNEFAAKYGRVSPKLRHTEKMIGEVMSGHEAWKTYNQADGRGPALYLYRPADLAAGEEIGDHDPTIGVQFK
jgi:hypothetical protein